MTLDLTDEEKLALAAELKRTIAEDRYPLSPRICTLEAILAKIEPQSTVTRAPLPASALTVAPPARVPPARAAPSTTVVPPGTAVPLSPEPQPTSPAKVFSQTEKEYLKNVMRDISKIIEGQGDDVDKKIDDMLTTWNDLSNSPQLSWISAFTKKLDDLTNSLSTLRSSLNYQDGAIIKRYRSYSEEIKTVLDLQQDWRSNPIENLSVMADRFKQNTSVVNRAANCSEQQLWISLVQQLDLGFSSLQIAASTFSVWLPQTQQRIGNFKHSFP